MILVVQLARSFYLAFIRMFPLRIVPGGTKRMEGFVKIDKELDELISRLTQLDKDMIDNDKIIIDAINQIVSKITEIETKVTTLQQEMSVMKNIGMIFVGEYQESVNMGQPNGVNTFSIFTSKGIHPNGGGVNACEVEQITQFNMAVPSGFSGTTLWVSLPYRYPCYEYSGQPGANVAIRRNTIDRLSMNKLHNVSLDGRFFSYSYNGMSGHGQQGYVVDVYKIVLYGGDSFSSGETFDIVLANTGSISISGFDNPAQFPVDKSSFEAKLGHPAVGFATIQSWCRVYTSKPTSL